MAEPNSSPVSKPHLYDLLGRLNAAFSRVQKYIHLLNDTGVFEPQTMTRLHDQTEEVRANTNCNLLETLHSVEEKDCEAFRQQF